MASSATIPPFLLPRGISKTTIHLLSASRSASATTPLQLHHRFLRRYKSSSSSSSSSSKNARILEKPDKFRPPSHPARRVVQGTRAAPRNYPGPPPSAKEAEERRTKKYPNMFPPEGTVMYKFLTSRGIHVWIAMGVLMSLASFTWSTNFKRTSPYAHLLPSWSDALKHPFNSISGFFSVMKMHSLHTSLQASERRKRGVDDVEKRREYRIAHGLEKAPVKESDADDDASPTNAESVVVTGAGAGEGVLAVEGAGNEGNRDVEGGRRPIKKWFGIW